MKKYFFVLFITFFSFSTSAIIHGEDDRYELENIKDIEISSLAESIPVLVRPEHLVRNGDNYKVRQIKKDSDIGICEGNRFHNQSTISTCTGVLISPKHILTDGHCFKSNDDCNQFKFVFGYKLINGKAPTSFHKDQVYSCKSDKLVAREYVMPGSIQTAVDYAIIELDRNVIGYEVSELDLNSEYKVDTPVFIVGSNLSTPLKVSLNANIIRNKGNLFSTTLDSDKGNSGAPIFNKDTMKVIGINTLGPRRYFDQYIQNKKSGKTCYKERKDERVEYNKIFGVRGFKISLISDLLQPILNSK